MTSLVVNKLFTHCVFLCRVQIDCPASITLFVLGSGSDYCAVHKMYVRGHEIATYGVNRTGNTEDWTELDWEQQFVDHAELMVEKAFLPDDHVRGARTPLQKPGGDDQFSTLYNKVRTRRRLTLFDHHHRDIKQ